MDKCPHCGRPTPCWSCQRTCRRKKRYATYAQAKEKLLFHRQEDPTDILLDVYKCPIEPEHYHLGHATGRRATVLLKRAEKQRRKALIRDVAS